MMPHISHDYYNELRAKADEVTTLRRNYRIVAARCTDLQETIKSLRAEVKLLRGDINVLRLQLKAKRWTEPGA